MARIRSLKPELCLDEQLADCDIAARLMYVLLMPHCDDGGVHQAKPRTVKAEVFPHDEGITAAQVSVWMCQLIEAGLVVEYEVAGERFWCIRNWLNLQKVEKPNPRFPRPDSEGAVIIRRDVGDPSPPIPAVVADESPKPREDSPADGRMEGREGVDRREGVFSVADATAATAASGTLPGIEVAEQQPMTAKARVFALGKAILGDKAGALLGKWSSTYGDAQVAQVLADAAAEEPHEPKAWITKALEVRAAKQSAGQPSSPLNRDERPAWLGGTGFASVWEAESAGCGPGNAKQFRNGQKVSA
jgi:hypothetical protein